MQHVLDALYGGAGDVHVGEVALEELDLREVCQIVALAGDEAVDDADAIAAADEGFGNVGADETGPTRNEKLGHERASGSASPYSFQNA